MSRDASASLVAARLIDARCDEFESALAAGQSPTIESFLTGLPPENRQTLLVELLGLEIDFRVARGERPEAADYAMRFPELPAEKIVALFETPRAGPRAASPQNPDEKSPDESASQQPTLLGPNNAGGNAGDPAADVFKRVRYFGDYELLREIARGGMGVVYEARQRSLNRPVALKMILSGQLASAEQVARFRREAEAAAQLDHPGIVPIFEIGTDGDQHYFAMAYVSGPSLSSRLLSQPLEPREAAALVRDVALAVQYAHERGVVHRDLKPSNILLAPRTDRPRDFEERGHPSASALRTSSTRVTSLNSATSSSLDISTGKSARPTGDSISQFTPRVTDFGLAKFSNADHSLTETGQILGTPSYMPPEQAAGLIHEVGPAADIYSLGAVLYACLTGRPPFQSASAIDTVRQVLERDPVSLRDLNIAVPQDLETISLKCLEKSIPRRYATAKEMADELQRYLDGHPILARPVSRVERVRRWCRRNPTVAALMFGIAVSLISGIAASSIFAIQANNSANDAKAQESLAKKNERDADEQKQKAIKAEQTTRETLAVTQDARDEARQELAKARSQLYAADMQLAGVALAKGEVAVTLRHLENHHPVEDGTDLREWEWYYLRANCFEHDATYRAHDRSVEVVTWNPAGDRFAASDSAGRITVWAVNGNEPLRDWQLDQPQPFRLSWDSTGQWLVASPVVIPNRQVKPEDRKCFVWNVATGEVVLTHPACDVAWNGKNPTLAGAHSTSGVWTWKAGDPEVTRVEQVSQTVTALAWLPDGEQLALASTDKVLIVRSDTGETVATLNGFEGELGCVSISSNGEHLAGATRFVGLHQPSIPTIPPETVVAWKLSSGEVVSTWKTPVTAAGLKWSPDSTRIALSPSSTVHAKVTVFGLSQPETLLAVDGMDASWHAQQPLLAIAERNGVSTYVTYVKPLSKSRTLRGHLGQVYAVQWNPNDTTLVSASGDTTLRRWQGAATGPQQQPQGSALGSTSSHERYHIGYRFDPKTMRNRTELIDKTSGAVLLTMDLGYSPTIHWSRAGDRVLLDTPGTIRGTERTPATVTAWDAKQARVLWNIEDSGVSLIDWSPDDKQLLWLRRLPDATKVQLVSVDDRAVQSEWAMEGRVMQLVWSPTGKQWACVLSVPDPVGGPAISKLEVRGTDGVVQAQFAIPEGCDGTRGPAAFSHDGQKLAWGVFDSDKKQGRIFVWDLETRQIVTEFHGHEHPINSLQWNRKGTRLASGNFRETKLWHIESGLELITMEPGSGTQLRWSDSGRQLFGQIYFWDATRGFNHADPLPPNEFKTFVRPMLGSGFF